MIGSDPRGPEHPRVEAKKFCVRDLDHGRDADLGIVAFYPGDEITDLEYHGIGHTFSDASDEIEERVDLEAHRGEDVATVLIDLDEGKTEYRIEWHVDDVEPRTIGERVRGVLPL
jgi:hypothetical protein